MIINHNCYRTTDIFQWRHALLLVPEVQYSLDDFFNVLIIFSLMLIESKEVILQLQEQSFIILSL